jgi:hypothetical protein
VDWRGTTSELNSSGIASPKVRGILNIENMYNHTEQYYGSRSIHRSWKVSYVIIYKSGIKFQINYRYARYAYLALKRNPLFFIFIALTETGVVAPDLPDAIQIRIGSRRAKMTQKKRTKFINFIF